MFTRFNITWGVTGKLVPQCNSSPLFLLFLLASGNTDLLTVCISRHQEGTETSKHTDSVCVFMSYVGDVSLSEHIAGFGLVYKEQDDKYIRLLANAIQFFSFNGSHPSQPLLHHLSQPYCYAYIKRS